MESWRKKYENIPFSIQPQPTIDDVILEVKKFVLSGSNFQVPIELNSPRGRPVKNAGKRKKGWYERGPITRKIRSYSWYLCHLEGQTASQCDFRQLFEPMQEQ